MGVSRGQVGAAIGIATLAPTIFAFSGPNIADMREKAADPKNRPYIRQAQYIGAATVIGLGIAVGLIVDDRDWWTVLAATAAAGGMVLLYEHALQHPTNEPDESQSQQQLLSVA